ncbi:MAG: hypothetical protein CMK01_08535 [Planktomarina sp.]|jgi:DsbC/DsbD-like thiol-disulfide interchange protein|nr:hypothetical protein [Planktomarina sp.]
MVRIFISATIVFFLLSGLKTSVLANKLNDIIEVNLLQGWREDNGTHISGLEIILAPGWKTYWRYPGDTGIPPQFDFSNSYDLKVLRVMYPVPKFTWEDGFRSIGYHNSVIFPIIIQTNSAEVPTLNGKVDLGICKDVCIPASFTFSSNLLPIYAKDHKIENSIRNLPERGREKITCYFTPVKDGLRISLSIPLLDQEIQNVIIELENPNSSVETPKINRIGNQFKISANIITATGGPISVKRSEVVTTIFSDTVTSEFKGCYPP